MEAIPIQTAGLTSAEAERRLALDGLNEPSVKHLRSPWLDLLALFSNPLSVILLTASVVSALVGDRLDAALIALMVLLGTGIDFFQSYRSRVTMDRLRSTVAATATVLRDGCWSEIPRSQLVAGDVLRLSAGDLVPADALILESSNLYVQEASLTGESLPVAKGIGVEHLDMAMEPRKVFLGTSVVSGSATVEVTSTGPRTAFGDIAVHLQIRPPETAFDVGLKQFGYLITRIVFLLVLVVLLMNLLMHRAPMQSLLFAVALAVGLTPEFLPMITSATLAKGAMAMARRQVVVKHLSAIQNLGSIDILCSDKTGTLTSGAMTLASSLAPDGTFSGRPLELAAINSQLQTGLRSPLDVAILAASAPPAEHRKCGEIPFDFERRLLSVVIEEGNQRQLICKGSPESLFPLLACVEMNCDLRAVDEHTRAELQQRYNSLSSQGLRVLGVAHRTLPQQPHYTPADEQALTFAGFVAFSDPILPETPETIARLYGDGVTVKILSGDNDLVTARICAEAGLAASSVVLGSEIERMTPSALAHVAEQTHIFARLTPAQKLRVIAALRTRGHVVGFIGDGINDAPSLRAADVGIAAPHAVDIAQESADVVLLQAGLRVLHEGIVEGRKAFGNVMKYLFMGTSSNFGNVLSMAIASPLLPFLPMLPTQILLNNFLYDSSQLTIPTDRVDPEYTCKPQQWDISVIRRFMLYVGPISSIFDFLTFYVLLRVYRVSEAGFHTGWFVESLATQTLVLLVIRTGRSPLRSRPSYGLLTTVIGVVVLGVVLPWSPFAAQLRFVPLPGGYFAFLGTVVCFYLALVEWMKRVILRRPVSRSRPHFRPADQTPGT